MARNSPLARQEVSHVQPLGMQDSPLSQRQGLASLLSCGVFQVPHVGFLLPHQLLASTEETEPP